MLFTSPSVGRQSIAISVYVCLSVCWPVCPLAYLKYHTSKFHIFCVFLALSSGYVLPV